MIELLSNFNKLHYLPLVYKSGYIYHLIPLNNPKNNRSILYCVKFEGISKVLSLVDKLTVSIYKYNNKMRTLGNI